MEVDERLYIARFHLYHDVNNNGDEQSANKDICHGKACHDASLPAVGEIMADEAECHKTEHPWVSADDLPQ